MKSKILVTPNGDFVSDHEYFLGDGFWNTLDDIKNIAGTVGSVSDNFKSKGKSSNPVVSASGVVTAPSAVEKELQDLQNQIYRQQLSQAQSDLARKEADRRAAEKQTSNILLYGGIGIGVLAIILVLVFILK